MVDGRETPAVALTIAGSDSGGGAGIQADLVTFAALGVHGASAVTALTAQNTLGVSGVHVPPVEFLRAQLDAVLADLPVAAVKTGMLATEEVVLAVAEYAAAGRLPNLVVDPVLVSSTGARLLDAGAETAYREGLFPHALVVTPNTREAQALLGARVESLDDARQAARKLAEWGPQWVVVKGGHLVADGGACDVVVDERDRRCHRAVPAAHRHPQRPRHRLQLRRRHRRRARPGLAGARGPGGRQAVRARGPGAVGRLGARRRPRPRRQARRLVVAASSPAEQAPAGCVVTGPFEAGLSHCSDPNARQR